MIIGSHVSFGAQGLVGSVKEAISYGANTFMFYTGAPQNTIRKPINEAEVNEALTLMKEHGIDINKVICHAPYIVNLANNKDISKYEFSINFLKNEVKRCDMMQVKYLVLHPGSSVGIEKDEALLNIVNGLNEILKEDKNVTILLETMAGKGTELGKNLEELKYLITNVENQEKIGICLDTCHLNDAGYDMSDFDNFLELFDKEIGLQYIKCIHINDSKNALNTHKDRHENIGFGTIGFDSILHIVNHSKLDDIPKILETPYVGESSDDKKRIYPPYKFEIAMLKKGIFDVNLKEEIINFYQKNSL